MNTQGKNNNEQSSNHSLKPQKLSCLEKENTDKINELNTNHMTLVNNLRSELDVSAIYSITGAIPMLPCCVYIFRLYTF